jgi:hypothetical protein
MIAKLLNRQISAPPDQQDRLDHPCPSPVYSAKADVPQGALKGQQTGTA